MVSFHSHLYGAQFQIFGRDLATLKPGEVTRTNVVAFSVDQDANGRLLRPIGAGSDDNSFLVRSYGSGLRCKPGHSRAVRHNTTSLIHNANQCAASDSVARAA